MKKITILSLHLNHGGIEKYISNLANILCDNFDVEIACIYKLNDKPVYIIDNRVKIKYLLPNLKPNKIELKEALKNKNIFKIIKECINSVRILKGRKKVMINHIKNIDEGIVISTRIMFTKLLSKYGNKKVIKIAQEHCYHNNNEKYIKSLGKYLKNINYFMASSYELTSFYQKRFTNLNVKFKYLPLPIEPTIEKTNLLDNTNIIAVGRLSKEKGFSDLIDVFDIVFKSCPDWKLHIIGNGDEYNNIKEKINNYHLNDSILMHGFQPKEKVYENYHNSSIYAMTSFEESFGLVLLEAGLHGLPCVAFSCATGACEIINNNNNGFLIDNRDKQAMADCIIRLINDKPLRIKMGKKAKKDASYYLIDNLKNQYISFFKKVRSK